MEITEQQDKPDFPRVNLKYVKTLGTDQIYWHIRSGKEILNYLLGSCSATVWYNSH